MKVVWLSECPTVPSGFGKATKYMVYNLKQLGFDVTSLCYSIIGKADLADGTTVVSAPNTPTEVIQKFKPDVVVMFGAPWIVPLVNFLPLIPSALSIDRHVRFVGYFIHEFLDAPENIKKVFRLVHFMAVTNAREAKYVGIDRYHVVPHGVNTNIWNPDVKPMNDFKRIANIDYVIGMVAKNHPRKRFDIFLESVAIAAKKLQKKIGILPYTSQNGFWNLSAIYESVSKYYSVMLPIFRLTEYEAIFGLPEQQQAEFLAGIDIHMLPTLGEAWSLPIDETLALGKPNITTDTPVLHDIYGDYVQYVKPVGHSIANFEGTIHYQIDAKKYADKIVDVVEHYDEYKEKALKAFDYVKKLHTWERAAKEMATAIDKSMKYDYLISSDISQIQQPVIPYMPPKLIS